MMMVCDASCELMLRLNGIVFMIIVMSEDVDLGVKTPYIAMMVEHNFDASQTSST
jgi:hypothetical protein